MNTPVKALLFVLGSFVLLFVLAVALFGETPEDETQASTEPTATAEPTNTPEPTATPTPLPQVNAAQLAIDYEGNQLAADRDYKDRRFVINGRVADVGKGLTGAIYITFDTRPSFNSMLCEFDKEWEDELTDAEIGGYIEVEGRIDGVFGEVVSIEDCSIP